MSKDGGGYSRDEGVELVSLASQVRTLKIQIEGYKQHIQIAEKSYKEHVDRLKAQVQMSKTYFEPTKEEVIKALKRIYGYSAAEAHRYGPQKIDKAFVNTLNYLKKQFEITEEDIRN